MYVNHLITGLKETTQQSPGLNHFHFEWQVQSNNLCGQHIPYIHSQMLITAE